MTGDIRKRLAAIFEESYATGADMDALIDKQPDADELKAAQLAYLMDYREEILDQIAYWPFNPPNRKEP